LAVVRDEEEAAVEKFRSSKVEEANHARPSIRIKGEAPGSSSLLIDRRSPREVFFRG
jgi:hypothetical protein